MSQFLDLLNFSKRYHAKNCSLANLYWKDSSVDRASKDIRVDI